MTTRKYGYPIEADVRPIRVDVDSDLSEGAFSGKLYYGPDNAADRTIILGPKDVAPGSVAKFIQIDETRGLILKPDDGEIELPDGSSIKSTDLGLKSMGVGSELEILYYLDPLGSGHFRAKVVKGCWRRLDEAPADFYPSTDTNPRLVITAGKVLSSKNTLTLKGTDSTEHTFPPRTSALKYTREIQRLVSANDTTVTLDDTYAEDIIVTGSGVMYVLDLGVATGYQDSDRDTRRFTIYNATPEFIGVVNSDLSTFHRVPPRSRCTCVLVDNSSPAGVWFSFVDVPIDLDQGRRANFDASGVISQHGYSDSGFVGVLSGAGAGIGYAGAFSGAAYQKILGLGYLRTGTTDAGYAVAYGGYLRAGLTCLGLEFSLLMGHYSTALEEFIFRAGFGENATGAAHSSGAYFEYDRVTSGDFWRIVSANAASRTAVVTDSAPALVTDNVPPQKLRLELNSGQTRIDAWINQIQKTAAGGITTDIIAANSSVALPVMTMVKSAGTTSRYAYFDYYSFDVFPTTKR